MLSALENRLSRDAAAALVTCFPRKISVRFLMITSDLKWHFGGYDLRFGVNLSLTNTLLHDACSFFNKKGRL